VTRGALDVGADDRWASWQEAGDRGGANNRTPCDAYQHRSVRCPFNDHISKTKHDRPHSYYGTLLRS